jgi:hypothetical protein
MLKIWKLLLIVCLTPACATFDRAEPLLYPGGFPTADTLRDDEWQLAPPPWGWVAYGVTPRLTVGWDYPATLMGYPAGLVRYQFGSENPDVRYAVELYGAVFTRDHTDSRNDAFMLERNGTQDWIHFERTARLSERWRWHLYGGLNYASFQRYVPHKGEQFEPVTYEHHVSPDFGVALQWDALRAMKVHVNYTYGNTLYFVDQVALKRLAAATLHFAPFSQNRAAVLRNLRFDLSALHVNVPIAKYRETLPLPLYPTVYWQWGGSRAPGHK